MSHGSKVQQQQQQQQPITPPLPLVPFVTPCRSADRCHVPCREPADEGACPERWRLHPCREVPNGRRLQPALGRGIQMVPVWQAPSSACSVLPLVTSPTSLFSFSLSKTALPSCCTWQENSRPQTTGTPPTCRNGPGWMSICPGNTRAFGCLAPKCS